MKNNVYKLVIFPILLWALSAHLFAQNNFKQTPIAILDFSGDGLTEQALRALTNHFRGNLVELKRFTILDRGKMSEILEEQGFQLSGCTSSECAVEVGKILNVQKMVAGNIGKVGGTYTINISFIDVESSRIENAFNRTYSGKIDGIIQVFKEIAYTMSGKGIKKASNAPLYLFGSVALASAGFGAYAYLQGQKNHDDYLNAQTSSEMNSFKEEVEKFDDYLLYSSIAAGSSVLLYFLFDGILNSGDEDEIISAHIYPSTPKTYQVALTIHF
jgi:TolB-like protein